MLNFSRLTELRDRNPLLHCVNNSVTANDCANLALAVGASPMMAEAVEEMEEVTRLADSTVLNTGTPSAAKFRACLICGKVSAHPIVLDPVGIGASAWRLRRIRELLDAFTPTILRVNSGEALALLRLSGTEHGVDSPDVLDTGALCGLARELSQNLLTCVLLSGADDVISDGARTMVISGGSPLSSRVTGAGCMLSVLCGAFASVARDAFEAAALASSFWKIAAELAPQNAGTGSFRTGLIDAASLMTEDIFKARFGERCKYL